MLKSATREDVLLAVLDAAPTALLAVDREARIILWNAGCERLYGHSAGEVIGGPISVIASPERRAEQLQAFHEALLGHEQTYEAVRVRKGGERIDVSISTSPVRDASGAIIGASAVARELRDVRRAARTLLEEHLIHAQAQTLAHVGSFSGPLEPPFAIRLSAEGYRIFGLPPGTPILPATLVAQTHPDDRPLVEAVFQARDRGEETSEIVHRILRPDGGLRWIRVRGAVLRDEAGRPAQVVGAVQDITEHRRAVDELCASEARFRRIIEATSEGIWATDMEGRTTFVNRPMARMLGCEPADMLGQAAGLFMDEDGRRLAAAHRERGGRGPTGQLPRRLLRKDGTPIWTHFHADPLLDGSGNVEGSLAIVRDVTESQRSEAERARLAAIVESSEDGIASMDLDGTVRTWNAAAERITGFPAAWIIGRRYPRWHDDEDGDSVGLLARIARGETVSQRDVRRKRKDGSTADVSMTFTPLRDGEGRVVGASVIARDLTERRRAEAALRETEEQLRQAQKLEAIGGLAGGVAHDFNNMLSVILSYSSLLLDDLGPRGLGRAEVQEIKRAAERSAEITQQLLAFSRKQVLSPRVIDLNEVLGGMRKLLGRMLGEQVQLTLAAAPRVHDVVVDPAQMEQVIINLAVNARDAMLDGGELTMETADVTLAGRPGVEPGPYVLVAVTDTGVGMDRPTQERMFEPFFTTKKERGTGLGLATVFGIVKQSGGHLEVDSAPGRGTTVRVYLPRSTSDRRPSAAVAPAPATLRGSETVLLVEDDEQVRVLARTILRNHGYQVLEAANAGEALLAAEQHPGTVHLLLTDCVLPRLTGHQLADRLLALRPDLRVLYMSGYGDETIAAHGVLEPGTLLLPKPFTPDRLARKVREALER